MRGKIKIIRDNFGFITGSDGKDYYFNDRSLDRDLNWQDLSPGMDLEFDIVKASGGRGNDSASNCKAVENEIIVYFKENALHLSTINSYDEFCDNALEYAKHLQAGKVTTSMLRKVYSRVLNAADGRQVKMLRPQFAYIAGREKNNLALREFMDLLDSLAKSIEVERKDQLKNLKQFMEAIVAYMKYVGDAS